MKSMNNVKKLVVAGLGAAFVAAGLAVAPLHYQDTELVSDTGQPTVKVVVGHNAAASDGVAAAYIASVIANRAYRQETISAEIQGTGTCTGGNGGEGQCSVLDESVTLEFTTPGQAGPGEYYFSTYIADYIDRETKNRDIDTYNKKADITDPKANPYQNQLSDYFMDPDYETPEHVAYDTTVHDYRDEMLGVKEQLFPTWTVTSQIGSGSWEEQEGLWIAGESVWVKDEGLLANVPYVTYTATFEPNEKEKGLPLCPGDEDTPYAQCSEDNKIEARAVYVHLLGKKYVVSEVHLPSTTIDVDRDKEIYKVDGAYIKLAEEAYPPTYLDVEGHNTLNVSLNGYNYKVTLTGVNLGETCNGGTYHPALFNVSKVDAAGNVVETKRAKICPGDTDKIDFNSGGEIRMHVYETAATVNIQNRWAQVSVYANEITLKEGDKFNDGESDHWKVSLGWMGDEGSGHADNLTKYLKQIVIYRDEPYGGEMGDADDMMKTGDSRWVLDDVDDYKVYKVEYQGHTNPDTWNINMDAKEKLDGYTMKAYYYDGTDKEMCTITNYSYVKIKLNNIEFEDLPVGSGETINSDEVYYIPYLEGGNCTNISVSGFSVGTNGTVIDNAFIVAKDKESGDKYLVKMDTYSEHYAILTTSDDAVGVMIVNNDSASDWTGGDYSFVGVVDQAGKWEDKDAVEVIGAYVYAAHDGISIEDPNTGDEGKFVWGVYTGTDSVEAAYDGNNGNYINESNILRDYKTVPTSDGKAIDVYTTQYYSDDEDFYSWRGSTVSSADEDTFNVKVPMEPIEMQYKVVDTTANGSTSSNGYTRTMKEGDTYTIPNTGVTVKVKSIDEQLGTCQVGDGGSATCDMSNVQALIMPDGVTQKTVITPYDISSLQEPLVVMDNEVTSIDTEHIISVGGPVANDVTKQILSGTQYTLDPNTRIIVEQVEPGKIVVAGYEAEDTLDAAKQFVQELTSS